MFTLFFPYAQILEEKQARHYATVCRQTLIERLTAFHQVLMIFNTDNQLNLNEFLDKFTDNIHKINPANTATTELETLLSVTYKELEKSTPYKSVTPILQKCLQHIKEENHSAKNRHRNNAKNDRLTINFYAVYTATIPTIGIGVGIVLYCFNPIGLTVTGISAATLLLSQAIYWFQYTKQYRALGKQLETDDFPLDLNSGVAVRDGRNLPNRSQPIIQDGSRTPSPLLQSPLGKVFTGISNLITRADAWAEEASTSPVATEDHGKTTDIDLVLKYQHDL